MSDPGRLLDAWREALPDAEVLGADLLGRWSEPQRHYHDLEHLAEVLAALDELAVGAVPASVRLAAWFHDAIYDPRAADNEERSAALAAETLPAAGLAAEDVSEVVRLVRLTATHDPASDDDAGMLMCDADLAILASSPARYARYVADVREEYAHVPDAEFRAARDRILREFVERSRIYRTDAARDRWESAARRNITAELAGDADPPR